jgi:hypothetical protein
MDIGSFFRFVEQELHYVQYLDYILYSRVSDRVSTTVATLNGCPLGRTEPGVSLFGVLSYIIEKNVKTILLTPYYLTHTDLIRIIFVRMRESRTRIFNIRQD